MADAPTSDAAETTVASRISRLVVHTVSEYTGRGPVHAHTTVHGDLVTTLLRDTLTKGERSLIADGRRQLVLDMRKAFQDSMGETLTRGVEEITGRPVIAFLSDNNVEPDIGVEVFVLEPRAGV